MGRTFAYRLATAVPLVFLVSLLAFALVHLMPGSASETILGEGASPEAVAALDQQLGFDRPLHEQYWNWATDAVRGDFGKSAITSRNVSDTLIERFPVTLSVAAGGLLVAVIIGVLGGTIAALRQGRLTDRVISLATATGLAVPNFWVAILLAFYIGVQRGWLPAVGYTGPTESVIEWVKHLIMPSIALGLGSAAVIARQMRGGLLDVLERPYIRAARAKGLRFGRVVVIHGMKNALIPVATVIGFQASVMLGGAVLVEQIFGMPGIGVQAVGAVLSQDLPVVQGIVMVSSLIVILMNVMIDMSYAYFDPRVRLA
ncbi:ABC transporter permease [Candidatus Poriferisodalis sp.]|uniref:ABC transporter permease n=1 Tax=Candidatus Poriferisodalis sp. TaxID=3101277 RepID=UPI003B015337